MRFPDVHVLLQILSVRGLSRSALVTLLASH